MTDKREDLRTLFAEKLLEMRLPADMLDDLERVHQPLAEMISIGLGSDRMHIIGINGAQGAGKTTFSTLQKTVLEEGLGLRVLQLSIDDLYKSRSEREKMARDIHPLFVTRGVPGTHDIDRCQKLLDDLEAAGEETETTIPRFDKATDEKIAPEKCDTFRGRPDVVLFDGWCMGLKEQPLQALIEPVNQLEREEDPDAVWRTYVNLQLKTSYSKLFERLSLLVMLKVPQMKSVFEWRELQEAKLREKTQGREGLRVMNPEELNRFIQHYERLTRWGLETIPGQADLIFNINDKHRICLS